MSKLLSKKLYSYICGRQVVFVCIGTDLVGGDCLGPLVGQLLIESNINSYVYGTLSNPITAKNINKYNEFIRAKHPDSLTVAIDSAVGGSVGKICINNYPLKPGSADGKNLSPIGDISITATTSCFLPSQKEFSLVRLGLVYNLAKSITEIITDCLSPILYNTFYVPASIFAALPH